MLRLFIPVVRLHLLLFGATLQLTTLRYGGCNLRLDLHELIAHIKLQLPQRLLRIIGLLNYSVEIGPQQSKYTFQQIHENTSPVVIRFPGRSRGRPYKCLWMVGRGRRGDPCGRPSTPLSLSTAVNKCYYFSPGVASTVEAV